MSDEEKQRFEQFRSWHDEAYLYINQAITQEKPDIDRQDVALMMYQKGLGMLDLALCVDTESGSGPTWEKARKMQQKMSNTRCHVDSRIEVLSNTHTSSLGGEQQMTTAPSRPPPPADTHKSAAVPHRPQPPKHTTKASAPARPPPPGKGNDPSCPKMSKSQAPPSYEDAISTAPPPYTCVTVLSTRRAPYVNIQAELDEIGDKYGSSESSSSMVRSSSADSVGSSEQGEMLFLMENVQVFHVSPSGEVSTPSYPQTLHLVKFDREKNKRGGELPAAFVEVGDWTYPLVRGKSPVLKSDYGGYIFPDLDIPGGSVGIIIPDAVTETDKEIFDSLLAEITTAFKTQVGCTVVHWHGEGFISSTGRGGCRVC